MGVTPAETARYGGSLPLIPPRALVDGHVAFGLETPSLRTVTIDGVEVAQTITFSVRDEHWGTVESTNWSTSVDTDNDKISIEMVGRFTTEHIDLEATITVETDGNGSLVYHVSAVALRDFERARIGICVMHPARLAGESLEVTTPDGTYSTIFPKNISASRAVSNIEVLRHGIGATGHVVFAFEGELFEFEDQRNWTDNSFKTFCTPLSLPWPVRVSSGDLVEQSVRVSTGSSVGTRDIASRSGNATVHVDVGSAGKPMPSIGVLCTVDPEALSNVAQLGLPHVRISLDVPSDSTLSDPSAVAKCLGGSHTMLELEIVAESPDDLPKVHDLLAELDDRLTSVFVFDRNTQITSVEYEAAIDGLRNHTNANIGGGSGSNFGAINFNLDRVAFDSMQTLSFPMSPQVHYTDLFSVVTNLDTQAVVADNGKRIAGERPLSIGPITLLPRRAGDPLGKDPRSDSLFCAAWTVASMAELIPSGADSLTYHQIGGDAGIGTEDGSLTPTYHLLADLGDFHGAAWLPVTVDGAGDRVGAIGLRRRSECLVIVANVGPQPIDVDLDIPSTDVTLRILDETTYDLAKNDRAGFLAGTTRWTKGPLHLLPFAMATLKVEL